MQYRTFGDSGVSVSRLGFGAMRLPMHEVDGKRVIDEDLAIPMLQRAFELGVNYVDTALFYCDGQSEIVVGKALKGWRDKVTLSSKYPVSPDRPYRATLEKQLEKLDTDRIDFYHFHGIGQGFLDHPQRDEYIAAAQKAKDEGLIGHISFSFHDAPEVLCRLVDLGIFSSVLCQYNLLDRANEVGLAYAKEHGLGTVVMGPVGGGRIAGMAPEKAAELGVQVTSSAELALRFVLANPNVDIALSGMSTIAMVEENANTAATSGPLSVEEAERVNAAMAENRRLAELYCTGCDYCRPHCPNEVHIPRIFEAMNWQRIYGLTEHAQQMYDSIGSKHHPGAKADVCSQCGECEEHCPQHIQIRQQLIECLEVFGGTPV
ncbi:MAG TPA: aldo/keto reductase [Armatimonadetes bacterium]|nr:aldo/keto reductase [Armatimonadota bacterium]